MLGGLVKDLAGAAGSVAGIALGGPIGGMIGKELGAKLGSAAWSEFKSNPIGVLANPASIQSKFADTMLKGLGIDAPFRTLAKFAGDPMGAIQNAVMQNQWPGIPVAIGGALGKNDLKTNGQDVVDTGRYLVSMKESEVKVYDKQTGTWVKAYGDPHVLTSDGDKGQFHDRPLTINLQDGSKITIVPKKVSDELAVIDSVVINKGNEAVVVNGFNDGKSGLNVNERQGIGAFLTDFMQPDGTVLKAGHEVDDLFFGSGKEFRGSDPSKPFGEMDLDAMGKKYANPIQILRPGGIKLPVPIGKPEPASWPQEVKDLIAQMKEMLAGMKPGGAAPAAGAGGTGGTGGTGGAGGTKPATESASPAETKPGGGTSSSGGVTGSSVMSRIMEILAKLQDKLEAKAEELAGVEDEGKLRQGMFELQQLQNMIQQITSMATNIQKTHHDSAMGIIRNFT